MVRLLVVMHCGTKIYKTKTYKTKTFKDKNEFECCMRNVDLGNTRLIVFTDTFGTFVALSPSNCIIECEDCEE
jgi:hypothetical protein|nr:MAG TPA: hypothetical protein [Caudoviricetes sp.]